MIFFIFLVSCFSNPQQSLTPVDDLARNFPFRTDRNGYILLPTDVEFEEDFSQASKGAAGSEEERRAEALAREMIKSLNEEYRKDRIRKYGQQDSPVPTQHAEPAKINNPPSNSPDRIITPVAQPKPRKEKNPYRYDDSLIYDPNEPAYEPETPRIPQRIVNPLPVEEYDME